LIRSGGDLDDSWADGWTTIEGNFVACTGEIDAS